MPLQQELHEYLPAIKALTDAGFAGSLKHLKSLHTFPYKLVQVLLADN
jgi:hypothetical protein